MQVWGITLWCNICNLQHLMEYFQISWHSFQLITKTWKPVVGWFLVNHQMNHSLTLGGKCQRMQASTMPTPLQQHHIWGSQDLRIHHIHILIAPSLDVVPAYLLHLNPGPIPPGFYTRRAFHIYPTLKTLFPAFFAFSRIFARKREINALLTLVVVTGGGTWNPEKFKVKTNKIQSYPASLKSQNYYLVYAQLMLGAR